MIKRISLAIFLLLVFMHVSFAIDYPSRVGYVNDFANIISPDYEDFLNFDLKGIEKDTTVEIAIVTIESLDGMSIEEYSVKLFEKWEIGKDNKGNSLLILFANKEEKYHT